MKIYVVSANGKVSQEGYTSLAKAQEFIKGRYGCPVKIDDFMFGCGNIVYRILEIEVK